MLIVADSSALIALATCDGLEILLRVYSEVKVPKAVYEEVVQPEKPQAAALEIFLSGRVIDVDTEHWVLNAGGLGQARSKRWRFTSNFQPMRF
jgi:predicted nucleic acid-binding protein